MKYANVYLIFTTLTNKIDISYYDRLMEVIIHINCETGPCYVQLLYDYIKLLTGYHIYEIHCSPLISLDVSNEFIKISTWIDQGATLEAIIDKLNETIDENVNPPRDTPIDEKVDDEVYMTQLPIYSTVYNTIKNAVTNTIKKIQALPFINYNTGNHNYLAYNVNDGSDLINDGSDLIIDDAYNASVNDASVNDVSVNDASVNDASVNDVSVNDVSVNDVSVNDVSVNENNTRLNYKIENKFLPATSQVSILLFYTNVPAVSPTPTTTDPTVDPTATTTDHKIYPIKIYPIKRPTNDITRNEEIETIAQNIHNLVQAKKTIPPNFNKKTKHNTEKIKKYIYHLTKIWLTSKETLLFKINYQKLQN